MVTLQWFTCLFSYNFNFDVLQRLWDILFIKGSKIIFCISLAIYHLMSAQLLKCQEINEVIKAMDRV
jgi:hypothetical protein